MGRRKAHVAAPASGGASNPSARPTLGQGWTGADGPRRSARRPRTGSGWPTGNSPDPGTARSAWVGDPKREAGRMRPPARARPGGPRRAAPGRPPAPPSVGLAGDAAPAATPRNSRSGSALAAAGTRRPDSVEGLGGVNGHGT